MNTFALVVTRNEADRYLESCLAWHVPMFDGVLVYDDLSDDDTFNVVARSGASFTQRPDVVPTFMEHEAHFRQDSLDAMEILFEPNEGDWIAVVDADEFLVVDGASRFQAIKDLAQKADKEDCKSVLIPRPELWSLDPPMERVDGFWGGIKCTRLYRWEPGGRLNDKAMGCGNEPTYVPKAPIYTAPHSLKMLHVGYVEEADRKEKYERYSGLAEHGHNNKHIESILNTPDLKPYNGSMPTVWRGARST